MSLGDTDTDLVKAYVKLAEARDIVVRFDDKGINEICLNIDKAKKCLERIIVR